MDPTQAGMLTEAGALAARQLVRSHTRRFFDTHGPDEVKAYHELAAVCGAMEFLGVDAGQVRAWRDEVLTPATEPAGAGGEVRA